MSEKTALLFLLLCTACTVGPDYREPTIYENQQIAQKLNLSPTQKTISPFWYKQFQDPVLDELIETGLKNNPSVESGISKLRQARTLLRINGVTYLPMLSGTTQYDWTHVSKNIGLFSNTNDLQVGFDASWELDLWGAGRRLKERYRAETEQAFYTLEDIKVSLSSEIATAYFNLKISKRKFNIARQNLQKQKKIYQTVAQKYTSGLTDMAVYRQAGALVDSTESKIPNLENEIQTYQHALSVLIGDLPDTLSDQTSSENTVVLRRLRTYDPQQLYQLPVDIIRTRPDVKSAERALEAQNASIGEATANLYPNISLSTLFGLQSSAGSKLFNHDSRSYGYTPVLNLPIWNWEKLRNEVELQKEISRATFENYRQTLLTAVQELADAISAVQTQLKTNRSARQSVEKQRLAVDALRNQYKSGLVEFASLLQAEQNLLTAENDLADSDGALFQNLVAFYKATGGGYNNASKSAKE